MLVGVSGNQGPNESPPDLADASLWKRCQVLMSVAAPPRPDAASLSRFSSATIASMPSTLALSSAAAIPPRLEFLTVATSTLVGPSVGISATLVVGVVP